MTYINFIKIKNSKNRGIATLPTVMIIGMMALAVVVSITSISLNELLSSQGQAQSSKALVYAENGVRDALLKISRNKNYSCSSTDCYTIDFATNGCALNNSCSKVSVSAAAGDTANPKVITSKGILNTNIRTMQASVVLDNGTTNPNLQYGLITSVTWTELTN